MKEDKKRSTTDSAIVAALARWPSSSSSSSTDDSGLSLQEFVDGHRLPQLVRIVKGQYLNVGSAATTTTTTASTALSNCVLLCSRAQRTKVAAQCVKFKEDGRKVVPVGPRLAIPNNYDGWFEILSEEGRSMRHGNNGNGNVIESVAELARRFPDSCLVREPIKAYVARSQDGDGDNGGDGGGGGVGDKGLETITDKVRTIAAGETLVLVSEVLGTSAAADKTRNATDKDKGKSSTATATAGSGRFLRCFDDRGENVYLSFEQRGKFSAVAKHDNISGVHSIENLMSSKRLPMMVRLVSGKWPTASGNRNGKLTNFLPELRLFATFEEQCVMAMPLPSTSTPSIGRVVAVPLTARLKVQAAKNADALDKTSEFSRLVLRCRSLLTGGEFVSASSDDGNADLDVDDRRIHVMAGFAVAATPVVGKIGKTKKPSYFRRAFSDPSTTTTTAAFGLQPQPQAPLSAPCDDAIDEQKSYDNRYDEIDQIYDYVRGFAPMPMPKKIAADGDEPSPTACAPPTESATTNVTATSKPDPPPIETIPARRYADLPTTAVVVAAAAASAVPSATTSSSSIRRATDNLYEKIPQTQKTLVDAKNHLNIDDHDSRYYVVHSRSSSSSSRNNKMYVRGSVNGSQSGLHGANNNNNNRFISLMNNNRSSCGSGNVRHRCRFFRPLMMAAAVTTDKTMMALDNGRRNGGGGGGKSSSSMSSASPIFDIRYKSLTNLSVDSSQPVSVGAGAVVVNNVTSGPYIFNDDDDNDKRKVGKVDAKMKGKDKDRDKDRVVVAKNRLKKTMALMVVAAAAGPKLARPKSLSSLVVANNRNAVSQMHNDRDGNRDVDDNDDDDDVDDGLSTTTSSVVLLRRKVMDDCDDAKRIGTLYL